MLLNFFFVGLLLFGCASVPYDESVPEMSLRTFEVSKEVPGLRYPHRDCLKFNVFGKCKEAKTFTDQYDFQVPEVKQKFIDMGVECKVERKK